MAHPIRLLPSKFYITLNKILIMINEILLFFLDSKITVAFIVIRIL